MSKRFAAMVLCCALMINACVPYAVADDSFHLWMEELGTHYMTEETDKKTHTVEIVWNTNKALRIPLEVLRDVTSVYEKYRGTKVNRFGLEPQDGSKIRSTPDMSSSKNIIGAVHGDKSVYLYFYVFNEYGTKWYYAVTEEGIEGFVAAARIKEYD